MNFRRLHVCVIALAVLFAHVIFFSVDASAEGKRGKKNLDKQLRKALRKADVSPVEAPPETSAAMFQLGQSLFFDGILSGNQDISCATCHHPFLGTGDGLALPVGTGTATIGAIGLERVIGEGRHMVPRNAPEVFNRGDSRWHSQFWDSRIVELADGTFVSPAGDKLPQGLLDSVLSVQAMFPVTSRDEMRGSLDDVADGNEIAALEDTDLEGIWDALMERLRAVPGYRDLFSEAYGESIDDLGFDAVAKAIATFEVAAFSYDDTPLDEYLRGDNDALTAAQKRGALLFYGKANCASCHSGALLTDQQHHNLSIPQLGPGKDVDTGLDLGRAAESGDPDDLFRFRTPPLRNVAATGPWMHNGAYGNLRDAVRHHLHPAWSLFTYDPLDQLQQVELAGTVSKGWYLLPRPADIRPRYLKSDELDDVMAFLDALTAPFLQERLDATIPASVPSGLLVEPF